MKNEIVWEFVKGKTDDEMVSCVERILDIKFPEDYLECVRKFPGGYPSPCFFKNSRIEADFNYLLNFEPGSSSFLLDTYYILKHSSEGLKKLPDDIIPFARSGNDHLCFDYRGNTSPKVVYIDHYSFWDYLCEDEFREEEITEEDYLIYISDSFTEFLEMLDEYPEE